MNLTITFLSLGPLCVAGATPRHSHAPGGLYGRELDSSSQTVSSATSQAHISAPRGTVECAGRAGQGDNALPVERLQGFDSRLAATPARMRHGHRRYVPYFAYRYGYTVVCRSAAERCW